MRNKKVLVAMSGGVDSSVAALLLQKKGYDVTGAFMINYDDESGSCWLSDYRDALRVAARLGILLLKLDFRKEYSESVLDYMFKEYKDGRTPNPDVLCNKFVKFGAWLNKAKHFGFQYLATGHYASLRVSNKIVKLITARDKNKDQTYFLHQLNQKQLRQVLFPIGNLTKKEVRRIARQAKLPTADKQESMGICFVGETPIKDFLEKKIKRKIGKIISTSGEIIGQHQGLPFYTIGERHLGTGGGEKALYVVSKRAKDNALIVGPKNDPKLYSKKVRLGNVHWIRGHAPNFPLKCMVRLRHRAKMQQAVILIRGKNTEINFTSPQWGVTPGQFAVVYAGDVCLGGGVVAINS